METRSDPPVPGIWALVRFLPAPPQERVSAPDRVPAQVGPAGAGTGVGVGEVLGLGLGEGEGEGLGLLGLGEGEGLGLGLLGLGLGDGEGLGLLGLGEGDGEGLGLLGLGDGEGEAGTARRHVKTHSAAFLAPAYDASHHCYQAALLQRQDLCCPTTDTGHACESAWRNTHSTACGPG